MTAAPDNAVLITGGGIGGLATALALAKRDISSQILEKRSAFSEEGAGIQIGPNGTRILNDIGVLELLRDDAAAPDALQVRDGINAHELARLPLGSWIAERHGSPYWTAHRQDLHRALLEAATREPRITLHTDCPVETATQRSDSVTAILSGGREVSGQVLIGADGLWSALRANVFHGNTPRPAGRSAYRTVVPVSDLPAGLAANDVHIWLMDGAHVVHYPVRGGKEIAFVIILTESRPAPGWSTPVEAAFVRTRAQRLAPSLRVLLEAGQHWRMWSLHELATPRQWANGRIALLGDAAHAVLPFLAQGAVLALEDAAVLADAIANADGSFSIALARYEDQRRARALRVQAASRRNGRIYHLSGLLGAARDKVMHGTPPTLLMRQYDWLYGWRLR